jgi:hypothetical protein
VRTEVGVARSSRSLDDELGGPADLDGSTFRSRFGSSIGIVANGIDARCLGASRDGLKKSTVVFLES